MEICGSLRSNIIIMCCRRLSAFFTRRVGEWIKCPIFSINYFTIFCELYYLVFIFKKLTGFLACKMDMY